MNETNSNPSSEVPSNENAPPASPVPQPPGQATQEQPTAELYDLPDGRKVDAATLSREWKENFYPEYTRKSQALAAAQRQPPPPLQQPPTQTTYERPWEDPNYQPQTMAEVFEMADRRAQYLSEQREAAKLAEDQRIDGEIGRQLEEIKKLDPDASPDLIFQHATKYGFTNLVKAYENMTAFSVAVRKAEEKTAKAVAQRAGNGQFAAATVGADDRPVWGDNGESPLQMLNRLQGKK